jgi:hypothetical protein
VHVGRALATAGPAGGRPGGRARNAGCVPPRPADPAILLSHTGGFMATATKKNQQKMLDNQKTLLGNQKKIMANQADIKANQKAILANQKKILAK